MADSRPQTLNDCIEVLQNVREAEAEDGETDNDLAFIDEGIWIIREIIKCMEQHGVRWGVHTLRGQPQKAPGPLTKRQLIAAMESLPDDSHIFTNPHDLLIAVSKVDIIDDGPDASTFAVICTSEDN